MMTEEETKKDPILSKIQDMGRADLLRVLNGAYVAERFFGKTGSWFSQKLNNDIKNGKPCDFTKTELNTLANAIYTITIELQELADELSQEAEGKNPETIEDIEDIIDQASGDMYGAYQSCCCISTEALCRADNARLRLRIEAMQSHIDDLLVKQESLYQLIDYLRANEIQKSK